MNIVVAVSHGYDTWDWIETPFGFQSIIWTFVRHTVSRCLIFPALVELFKENQVSNLSKYTVVFRLHSVWHSLFTYGWLPQS